MRLRERRSCTEAVFYVRRLSNQHAITPLRTNQTIVSHRRFMELQSLFHDPSLCSDDIVA